MAVPSAHEYHWQSLARLPSGRVYHTLSEVGGQMYVLGGCDAAGRPCSTLEFYSPEVPNATGSVAGSYSSGFLHESFTEDENLDGRPLCILNVSVLKECPSPFPGGPMDMPALYAHPPCRRCRGSPREADPGGGRSGRRPETVEGGGNVQHGGREVEEEERPAGGPDGRVYHCQR